MTLVEEIRGKSTLHPGKPAVISGDRRVSYQELEESSNKVANALLGLGLVKGERVAVMLPNGPDFVIIFLGILKAGGIAVLLDSRYKGEELSFFFQETEPRVLVGDRPALEAIQPLLPRFSSIKRFIVLDSAPVGAATSYQDLLRQYPARAPGALLKNEDITHILYTSGTTGRPKGVMRSHHTLLEGISSMVRSLGQNEADATLNFFPSAHMGGLEVPTLTALMAGGTVVIPLAMTPQHLLEIIQKEKVTIFGAVPSLLTAMVTLSQEEINKYNLSSVRLCWVGGTTMSSEIRRKFKGLFGRDLIDLWVSTESGSFITVQPLDGSGKTGSAGKVAVLWKLKVVNDGGRELPANEAGELVASGPSVMVGYYKNPHATDSALKDGWLHTGDVGKIDEDGYAFILGRKKDVITIKGKEIYPSDIEDVLYAHPKVAEATVLGVPGADNEPVIKAVVVPRPGVELAAEEIRRFCQERLAPNEVPALVQFRDALPKTSVGKIRKEDLKT